MIFAKDIPEQRNPQFLLQLVCMVCHELRIPLNIVSLSTSLLKRHSHKWNEENKQLHLDQIQVAIEQVVQILDEVFSICKSEARQLQFEPKLLDIAAFCQKLALQMQMLSNDNQHLISFVSRGNCSSVYVDEKLLQPILTNLLSNAIKYSPSGSRVNLEVCCQDGKVIFQIKDAGTGISVADQQRLFEPFQRGSTVDNVPGSGLGLAVVKELVDLHKGYIDVVSEVGVGTTFTVTLPLIKENRECS